MRTYVDFMRCATWLLSVFCLTNAAFAARVDMRDPRRAVGTEDNVRVDAQLTSEFVSAHSSIGVTYKVHNLSSQTIAVADGITDASFDSDSSTITISIGSEVPVAGAMPRLVLIHSGQAKTLSAAASVRVSPRDQRRLRSALVQIRVNVLRDAAPFVSLTERQKLTDEQFEQWLTINDAIELNAIPVHYRVVEDARTADASRH